MSNLMELIKEAAEEGNLDVVKWLAGRLETETTKKPKEEVNIIIDDLKPSNGINPKTGKPYLTTPAQRKAQHRYRVRQRNIRRRHEAAA